MQKNALTELVFCIYSYFAFCFVGFCLTDVTFLCLYSGLGFSYLY